MFRSAVTRRLLIALAITAVGVAAGRIAGAARVDDLVDGDAYFYAVTALLAIGLYSSTHGIERGQMRTDLHTVVLAVTVGVLVKAAVITGVMVVLFPGPEALVLGVAVAQIDPLSVAALQSSSRLSPRGKSLLLAWASFDDPVTTLLTIYAATLSVAVHDLGRTDALTELQGGGLSGFVVGAVFNAAFAAVVCGLWWLVLRRSRPGGAVGFVVGCVLLVVAAVVAVSQFWMLGVALVGLFVRPTLAGAPEAFERRIGQLTQVALLLAILGTGFLLSMRVLFVAGLVLGVTAYAVHAIVSLPLTRGQTPDDRVQLAIAQQNGITAIVLSLLLAPVFPDVVATVTPAIVVINALHALCNTAYDRAGSWAAIRERLRPSPDRTPRRRPAHYVGFDAEADFPSPAQPAAEAFGCAPMPPQPQPGAPAPAVPPPPAPNTDD
ncbi:NhaP-type Na+/H+ or K+/H+ antiporter [Actinomadura pelletieri DSM 43383]|uniref:NhaP-type Na+/H+ or K+/H+ antiporter n=1 Tax=Actinomadura pelletieri DSM 43383 TaxID=1120940 RepID=A0A495R0P1_9ACTN|nr:hypothetical protein [Actinomadura pelletieri]RKS79852.1 NhaP-type Na+/H+ or K+/H+ antiporter [Actinomadura pelletieri DSM 43383]